MAIGKPRGNKRPSGGLCSSSVTTVVIMTVFVLGIWMLTTNSITSSSKTTIPIDTSYDVSAFLNSNRKIPIDRTSQDKLHVDLLSNASVYEDKRLDVAASHDDEVKTGDDQETGQSYKLDDDRDWLAETETLTEHKHEITTNIVDDDAESLNDSDVGKQEAEEQQEEAKEEQEIETSTSEIEDNTNIKTTVDEEHKHKSQNIEATDDQEPDTVNQEDNQIDTSSDLEDQQEEEKEQHEEDGPIESHSIAAETKARVENQEAQDVRTKMEQAKIKSITSNTTIPIKAFDAGSASVAKGHVNGLIDSYEWGLCNVTAGAGYIPCLDNSVTRQCPNEPPMCLVPLPKDYKTPISWPQSRDKVPTNILIQIKSTFAT